MNFLHVMAVMILICSFAKSDPCDPHRNGCTTYLPLPYSGKFKDSCDKHDICYSCSSVYNFSRYDCDTRFYKDMRKACGSSFYCKWWAYIYYKGVRSLGFLYHHGSEYFCRHDWVKPCMKK